MSSHINTVSLKAITGVLLVQYSPFYDFLKAHGELFEMQGSNQTSFFEPNF